MISKTVRQKHSRIRYVSENPNDFEWDITSVDGLVFEAEIQRLFRHNLNPDGRTIQVFDTPKTRDRGKDIVICFSESINAFGVELAVPRDKKEALLYVECKKTNSDFISPGDFGGSLLQLQSEGRVPDYFMLVTNGGLSPETLHNARERFKQCGSQFFLIDRYRLSNAIEDKHLQNLPNPTCIRLNSELAASYSVTDRNEMRGFLSCPQYSDEVHHVKTFDLYIALQNYGAVPRSARLSLRSDINWAIGEVQPPMVDDDSSLAFFIPPLDSRTVKLRLEQQSCDALEELRLAISVDGYSRTLEISGRRVSFEFSPPMFGEGHRQIVEQISDAIHGKYPPRVISLQGDAGTGKSRVLDEFATRCAGSRVLLGRVEIRQGHEQVDLGRLLRKLYAVQPNKTNLPDKPSIEEFISFLQRIPSQYCHYVVALEDIHHGSPDLLSAFRQIAEQKNFDHITIIATGRADGTFPNKQYFAFLDDIAVKCASSRDDNSVMDITLEHWSNEDCLHFIRNTIQEVPDFVTARIHKLSENTPFGVIQAIEYLLDINIVRVVNRNTVGVTNGELIAGKLELPEKISELIQLRMGHFVEARGSQAMVLLIALSILGMQNSKQVVLSLTSKAEDIEILEEAEERKFLEIRDQQVRICHENLQIFFRGLSDNTPEGQIAAKLILDTKDVASGLGHLQIGLLQLIAGNPSIAFSQMEQLWEKAGGASNISSIDLDANEFIFIKPLIQSAVLLNKPSSQIGRLCILETYLALHNLPLAVALETVERQYRVINELDLPQQMYLSLRLELQQLEAHILLNMGYVSSAQKIMIEIATKAYLFPEILNNYPLMFDVYDRLQNIYHQLNHETQFKHYSDLSKNIAEHLKDEKLISLVISSRTKEHIFNAPNKYLESTIRATEWAREHASVRHKCHAEINLCIAQLIAAPRNLDLIQQQIEPLNKLLQEATSNAYSFSVTRVELALSASYCLLGLDCEINRRAAVKYAQIGLNSSIRFGNGFFLWQLHNILAIAEIHERDVKLENVAGHWRTAIHYLDRQGLLFLGNLDSCSQNLSVISNFIRFLDEYDSDAAVKSLIDRLSYYDHGRKDKSTHFRHLMLSVRKHKLIGRKKSLPKPFSEPISEFLLALR